MTDLCPWCELDRHDLCNPVDFWCTCEQGACRDRLTQETP